MLSVHGKYHVYDFTVCRGHTVVRQSSSICQVVSRVNSFRRTLIRCEQLLHYAVRYPVAQAVLIAWVFDEIFSRVVSLQENNFPLYDSMGKKDYSLPGSPPDKKGCTYISNRNTLGCAVCSPRVCSHSLSVLLINHAPIFGQLLAQVQVVFACCNHEKIRPILVSAVQRCIMFNQEVQIVRVLYVTTVEGNRLSCDSAYALCSIRSINASQFPSLAATINRGSPFASLQFGSPSFSSRSFSMSCSKKNVMSCTYMQQPFMFTSHDDYEGCMYKRLCSLATVHYRLVNEFS